MFSLTVNIQLPVIRIFASVSEYSVRVRLTALIFQPKPTSFYCILLVFAFLSCVSFLVILPFSSTLWNEVRLHFSKVFSACMSH